VGTVPGLRHGLMHSPGLLRDRMRLLRQTTRLQRRIDRGLALRLRSNTSLASSSYSLATRPSSGTDHAYACHAAVQFEPLSRRII